jgi:hypothetical protein
MNEARPTFACRSETLIVTKRQNRSADLAQGRQNRYAALELTRLSIDDDLECDRGDRRTGLHLAINYRPSCSCVRAKAMHDRFQVVTSGHAHNAECPGHRERMLRNTLEQLREGAAALCAFPQTTGSRGVVVLRANDPRDVSFEIRDALHISIEYWTPHGGDCHTTEGAARTLLATACAARTVRQRRRRGGTRKVPLGLRTISRRAGARTGTDGRFHGHSRISSSTANMQISFSGPSQTTTPRAMLRSTRIPTGAVYAIGGTGSWRRVRGLDSLKRSR